MALEQIGLQAIFDDKNFQQGIARYQQGINQASSATDRGASIMSRLGSVASGALVIGIGAATTALAAFSAVAKIGIDAAMQQGEAIDKLGDMFGLSAKQANTWATAFTHFGVPVEEAAQQINFFTRGLSETFKVSEKGKVTLTPFGESLKKLGVSAYDAKGKLKTFDQIMPQIMDAFAKLPNGVNKSALAMDLFGARGGSKFLDFLSSGSKSLTDATKRVEEFGGMTDEQRDAIEQFGFELNDTRDNLQKIWSQIGLQLLPVLRRFVDFINTRILPAFSQWVREYSPRIVKSLQDFAAVLQRDVFPVLERAWNAVRGFVLAFQRGGISWVFSELERQLRNLFTDIIRSFNLRGYDLARLLGDIGGALSKALQDNWPKIQAELAKWGGRFWTWLTGKGGALEQAGTQLGKVKDAIVDWANENGPAVWDLVGKWANAFWNWITDSKSGVLVTIAKNMGELATNIELWTEEEGTKTRFQDIGKALARQILQGMGDLFNNPSEGGGLLGVLWRTLSRAAVSLRNAFANIGQNIARGVISGIAEIFVSPDEAARIGQSVSDALRNAAEWVIKYGNIPAIMFQLAQYAWGEFTKALAALSSAWNLFKSGNILSSVGGSGGGAGGSSYASGGPVTQTGLALVHAGEYVIPAPNVSNSRVTNFNFSHNWPAAVPASSRQWTEQMVRTVTHQEITSILGKV